MATNFKIKRSAVQGKKPATTDLELGELALNTYDGFLYAERTGHGAGVSLLTPWREKNVSPPEDIISYTGAVGIGSTDPEGKLDVIGNVNIVVPTVSNYRSVLFLANDSNISGVTADLGFDLKNGGARITTGSPNTSLVLGTQGSESIHIDTTGKVGIGTTNPKVETGGLYVNKGVNVAGLSTFHDDVNFIGATGISSITFDKSSNTLKFKDNAKLVFGDSDDTRIQHDAFRTIVRQHGVGSFVLDLLGDNRAFVITRSNLSEKVAQFNTNGSVDLYYDNSLQFQTTGYGVTVYGEAQFTGLSTFLSGASFLDNDVLYFGGSYSTGISTDHRLRIYSDGTDSYISEATGAGHLILSSDSRVEIKNAALNHTVASFNTGIGVTVNDRFKVVGIATLGSGASGQADLQYQGVSKLKTQSWGVFAYGSLVATGDLKVNAYNNGGSLNIGQSNEFTINHDTTNTTITEHVGDININASKVAISTNFSVGGISTFADDVTFQTANGNNIVFDNSDNSLQFGDSVAAKFGSGNDLSLFHTGSVGVLRNSQGNFKIEPTPGEKGLVVLPNAGVELYHNNNQKLVTTVDGVIITGILTATEATLGSIGISTGRITGPAKTYIDPATVGTAGTVFILGDLQVEGTQTVVNSSTMTVTDKNIELAKGAANDPAADGGGITVKSGDGDKTWSWLNAEAAWTSSEHIHVAAGMRYGFADDPNTYIDRPDADTIAFTHGGSEKVRITSTGSVRVGNTTTTANANGDNLVIGDITGNHGITILSGQNAVGNLFFGDSLNTSAAGIQYHHGTNHMEFRIAGGEKVRFTSGGLVGIGTDIPTHKLEVVGNSLLKGNISATGISTVVGVGTFKDDVYIDKKLYVGGIEIGGPGGPGIGTDITTRHLTVTGLSTFTGAIDANGDLDVDGHTELDNVNISGVTTTADIKVSAGSSITIPEHNDNTALFLGNFTTPSASGSDGARLKQNTTGNTTFEFNNLFNTGKSFRVNAPSAGGNLFYVSDNPTVGVKLFCGGNNLKLQTVGAGITVYGTTETQTLNVTGVSTFVSFLDVNDTTQSSDKDTGSIITEGGVGIEKNLNVGGIINSSTDVQINGTSVVDTALNDAVAMAIALG